MKSLATFSCCFQSLPEWTAVQHRRKSYVVRTKRLIRTGVPCSPVVFLWLITDSVNWTVMWMTRRYVGFKENTFVRLCTLQVAQIMLWLSCCWFVKRMTQVLSTNHRAKKSKTDAIPHCFQHSDEIAFNDLSVLFFPDVRCEWRDLQEHLSRCCPQQLRRLPWNVWRRWSEVQHRF